ncbi:MAG: hypothetical protein Kow00120_24960 [Anaerolineae bacterium]
MVSTDAPLLAALEPRLRTLLPADLYAMAWLDPSSETLTQVFKHLQTLQRILYDYVPSKVSENLHKPGEIHWAWHEGTLLFTDLKGFTPLMEAHAPYGRAGAMRVLGLLNDYFTQMIEVVSKSGGNLLEFTGDAILVEFEADPRLNDTAQAVRAGLRMQRAMRAFAQIETEHGALALQMRIGVHTGRFLTADIGTPRRMTHVLLGRDVLLTKRAEGDGEPGRVCLTRAAYARIKGEFRCAPRGADHYLVLDDLTDDQLGEYDITLPRRRSQRALLLDSSVPGLLSEIEDAVRVVEPVASYLPMPILNMLVENPGRRQIAPQFTNLSVIFVSLAGLSESADRALPEEEPGLVGGFSRVFALINAAVEAGGGVLKDVTYHPHGSGVLIYFGVPNAHTDDPVRAARAALAIRDAIVRQTPPTIGGEPARLTCQIGLSYGPAFAGEIGEPRGRRDFNIHSDVVNTAARLMARAEANQVLMTEDMHAQIAAAFECAYLGAFPLKGKTAPVPLYALRGLKDNGG